MVSGGETVELVVRSEKITTQASVVVEPVACNNMVADAVTQAVLVSERLVADPWGESRRLSSAIGGWDSHA